MGAVPQFGFIGSGGYGYPPNDSPMVFYTKTKWSKRKMGKLLQVYWPIFLKWNLIKKISWIIFVRLGLKILCHDFGESWIIFVACESFYHVAKLLNMCEVEAEVSPRDSFTASLPPEASEQRDQ